MPEGNSMTAPILSTFSLQSLFNALPDAISFVLPVFNGNDIIDFKIEYVNIAVHELLNTGNDIIYTNHNVLHGPLFDKNTASKLFVDLKEAWETGLPKEYRYYNKHTGRYYEMLRVRHDNGILSIARDKTDQIKAERERQVQTELLNEILNTSQTGIILLHPIYDAGEQITDFRFLMANRMMAGYANESPAALAGTPISKWFPNYKDNGLFERYKQTFISSESQRFDYHSQSKGLDVWLDILTTKMGDDLLVTFSDYTLLKQLQQKLEASVEDLRTSNVSLEQFAYVASHDLQEPLRKIQSFGEILRKRYDAVLGTEGSDLITRMQSAAERMQALIEDLLTFSHVSNQQHTLQELNLNSILQDVLTDLETTIKATAATISIDTLHPQMGDKMQLQQLFQNLLSNALKFARTDVPMQINITAREVAGANANVPIPAKAPHRFQEITIADNGIGFEQQYAEKIFQMFHRLHGRKEYPGTGVGLAIVQKVIENHGGYITATGIPGEGATFRILLPLS